MSCNCINNDCFPSIPMPCCTGTPGTAGVDGANGGLVLHNEFDISSVQTSGSMQTMSPTKEYTVLTTQIASIGDRIKVETDGEILLTSTSGTSSEVQVQFNGQIIGTHLLPAAPGETYFRIFTILDVKDTYNAAKNIRAYSRCEYTVNAPTTTTNGSVSIFASDVTVDYTTSPAKNITVLGSIYGVTPDSYNYCKCTHLCVEYFKKI